jgi:tRNA nucleotidyltransferase (CCA-adding enzyme)
LAEGQGLQAYLVGGPVRDLLLRRQTLDLDIAVEGEVLPLAEALAEELGGRVTGHERFGTAVVEWDSLLHVDLASTRREHYPEPGVLPEVEPAPLADDLWRRDFTSHALALPLTRRPAELIDLVGGRLDLELQALRGLHSRTFRDDPTRVIRAARYAATFDLAVEPETLAWLTTAVSDGMLRRVTGPRIWGELQRTLEAPGMAAACGLLAEWGALPEIGLPATERLALLPALVAAPSSTPGDVALAALGLLAGEQAAQVAEACGLSLDARESVTAAARMAATPPPVAFAAEAKSSTLHAALRDIPAAGLLALSAAHPGARANLERWRSGAPWQADVTGDDLLAAGHSPGPAFRGALQAALDAKLDDGADRSRQLQVALGALERTQPQPRDP